MLIFVAGKSLNDFNHLKLLIYKIIFLPLNDAFFFLQYLKVIDYFIIFVELEVFETFGIGIAYFYN